MRKHQLQVHKLTILSMMIALDVVLTPIFRIEGMAPMSSVVNILAGIMMGPVYALAMATVTAFSSHRSDFWSPSSRSLL